MIEKSDKNKKIDLIFKNFGKKTWKQEKYIVR